MREVARPEGVRVVFRDGTSLPVVIRYVGRRWWMHVWEGHLLVDDAREVIGTKVRALPPRTKVILRIVSEMW